MQAQCQPCLHNVESLMPMKTTTLALRASALLLATLMVGCAAPRQSLYSWNGYQAQVYNYLKNESPSAEEQILTLEKGVQQSASQALPLPPGYNAHLGLLYLNAGRTDQAIASWEEEKRRFPESKPYIDYLISNMKKNRS